MKIIRQFAEDKLVIATHNKGKLREIKALFDGFDFDVISAGSLGLAEPEETETSFRGNALLKARAAASAVRKRGLESGSALDRAATVNSLINRPNILARFLSCAPLRCIIFLNLEWPAMIF